MDQEGDQPPPPHDQPNASAPPILEYSIPQKPADNNTIPKFVLGLFLGPIAAVGFFIAGISGGSEIGVILAILFHLILGIMFISVASSRPFGIGFILGFPLAFMIVYSICALRL